MMPDELAAIFDYVKEDRKIDFAIYRTDTIERRMVQLLAATGATDHAAYLKRLKSSPAEIDRLINTLTITVSQFFRNPDVFDTLYRSVIPDMIETFKGEILRIWCAGCGRGEEAYSLAIMLNNLNAFSRNGKRFPMVLATDIDKKALEAAKDGRYSLDAVKNVPKDDIAHYFVFSGTNYRITEPVRSMVTFAYHDISTYRPPSEGIFSDYHLILCRNVLIYFNSETRKRIMSFIGGLLSQQGCLVLGEAEMIEDSNFSEVVPRSRIFRKGGLKK